MKNEVVVTLLDDGDTHNIAAFGNIADAEQFVAEAQKYHPFAVERGDYGIDAPEEMLT